MNVLLDVSEVSVSFGAVKALDEVTYQVEEGKVTALIGPNGAGKTTCLNAICGLVPLDVGEVRFNGRDISPLAPHKRRGMVRTFQIPQLFEHLTVKENVMVGFHRNLRGGLLRSALWTGEIRRQEKQTSQRAMELLNRMGIERLAGKRVETLTLGEQRLTEFARALAGDPELLQLDEAASGLGDAEMEELVRQIEGLRDEGRTVLLIEHNMRFVNKLADHLLVLDYGKLIFDGLPDQGVRDQQVISAYLGTSSTEAKNA